MPGYRGIARGMRKNNDVLCGPELMCGISCSAATKAVNQAARKEEHPGFFIAEDFNLATGKTNR